jgi:hypothetical protein
VPFTIRALAPLLLLGSLAACGHTQVVLRDTSTDAAVAAVTSAWSPNSCPRRHDEPDGTVVIEGSEGDNGAGAMIALYTLGLLWPDPMKYEVAIAPAPSGTALSVRVSKWIQVVYLIPVITRYEEIEERLIARISASGGPQPR